MVSKLINCNYQPVSRYSSPGHKEKIRILIIIARYPEYSETYMQEELLSVSEEFDINIISYMVAESPRKNHLPYQLIEYKDNHLNWGDFNLVNLHFTDKEQKYFLRKMSAVIRKYRPHIMHAHYFPTSLIIRKLSDMHGIPFTLRTHSFDMLQTNQKRIDAFCNAVDTPLCIGIFTFPAFKNFFIRSGMPDEKIIVSWPVVNVNRFYNTVKPAQTKHILCCGPCTPKKGHDQFIDLADSMRNFGLEFNLYTRGNIEKNIRRYNRSKNDPVNILYTEPEDMPAVYRNHDWLVYPSNIEINEVGFPCSIIEAQASGIGVCWQELPNRKQDQLDFMGGAGFLFKSINDVQQIISKEYPEEMRLLGLENAKKCDVFLHKEKLSLIWNSIRESEHMST